MASKLTQENRAEFKRYKEDVRKEGKPFFPYAIWHDTVMSLVVVVVVIGLAVIWKWTTPGDHTGFSPTGSTDHPDQAGWDVVASARSLTSSAISLMIRFRSKSLGV